MAALPAATLAIFVALSPPALYVLVKHSRHGALGWCYLLIFCTIRVVGSALSLSGSESAGIVSNIGLSPLLLAVAGILHEVRICTSTAYDRKVEWFIVLQYHIVVGAGVALLASGAAALRGNAEAKDLVLVKVGMAILAVSWVALTAWATQSLFVALRNLVRKQPVHNLLWCAVISLVFVGIRMIYGLVALVSQERTLSPTSGLVSVRVVLSLLPELATVILLLAGGILSRDVGKV